MLEMGDLMLRGIQVLDQLLVRFQAHLLVLHQVHLLVLHQVHLFLLYQAVHFLLVLNYQVLAVQPFRQTDFGILK